MLRTDSDPDRPDSHQHALDADLYPENDADPIRPDPAPDPDIIIAIYATDCSIFRTAGK